MKGKGVRSQVTKKNFGLGKPTDRSLWDTNMPIQEACFTGGN
jgi:hypothetical protein